MEVSIELLSLSLHDDPVDLVVDLRGVEHESVDVKEDALDEVKSYCLLAEWFPSRHDNIGKVLVCYLDRRVCEGREAEELWPEGVRGAPHDKGGLLAKVLRHPLVRDHHDL